MNKNVHSLVDIYIESYVSVEPNKKTPSLISNSTKKSGLRSDQDSYIIHLFLFHKPQHFYSTTTTSVIAITTINLKPIPQDYLNPNILII